MLNKIKKIFVISISSVLLITQPITICQAKLKPGQFNKEVLKWIEPYKERDDVPDSWTWYPEYDREYKDGELPKGARITTEYNEETKDVFYDRYWLNNMLWGGNFNIYHKKSVGFTKFITALLGVTHGRDIESSGCFVELNEKGEILEKFEKFDFSYILRQVGSKTESLLGVNSIGLVVQMNVANWKRLGANQQFVRMSKLTTFNVYLCFSAIDNNDVITFDITEEYLLDHKDFSYESLEKALDKYKKVCCNYYSHLGADRTSNGVEMDIGDVIGLESESFGWKEIKEFYSKNALLSFSGMITINQYGLGVKALDTFDKYYNKIDY